MSGKTKSLPKESEAVKPGPMTKDDITKIITILKTIEENPKCLEFIDPVDFVGIWYNFFNNPKYFNVYFIKQ